MQRYNGSRKGSSVYAYNDFLYHGDTKYPGRRYICVYKTAKQPCRISALVHNGVVSLSGEHNHDENFYFLIKKWAIRGLKKLAQKKIHLSPREIMNRVFARYPDAAVLLNPHSSRQHISTARREILPNIPKTLSALAEEMLAGFPADLVTSYHGYFRTENGKTGIVFTSDKLLEALGHRESTEIYIDGTFDARPRTPPSAQVLVIQIKKRQTGVPVALVLCECRTKVLYKALWQYLREMVPSLHTTVEFVISDFERALIGATRESLPAVRTRGCWIHFIRAVTRRWKLLKLPDSEKWKIVLGMVWSIPLVPAHRVNEAIVAVGNEMADLVTDCELRGQCEKYLRYLTRFWGQIPEIVSVAGHTFRTNNFSEGFNRQLPAKLGGRRPSLIQFLKGMHDIVQESERLWKQLTEGGMVMEQPRRLHRNSREERIRDYQRSLETGRFTMGEFLSQIFAPKVMNLKKYLPDEREGPVEWMEENEQADLQDPAVLFAAD